MKKSLLLCILLVSVLILFPKNVEAKVNIYMFRGNDCPHCEEALDYINNHKDEIPKDIEIITYEVWKNTNNVKLRNAVEENINVPEDDRGNVPLIVIGSEYKVGMLPNASELNEIITIAKKYVDNDEYEDIVSKTAQELTKENRDLKFKSLTLNQLYADNKVVNIIVFSIFGLIVVGFIGMIAFSRKN